MLRITFLLLLAFSMVNLKAQNKTADTTKKEAKKNGFRFYINGSEAMFPAVAPSAAEYKRLHQFNTLIDYKITQTGSALGLRNLIERHCDIAISTRKPTTQEMSLAKDANVELKEFVVAKEAWVIAVNPECGVYRLTNDQVSDIFSGKITNWKAVGGDDMPIHVFIRNNASGCYRGFKDMFFKEGEDYCETALQLTSNGKLIEQVQKYRGGIAFMGYNSFTSMNHNLVALKLSADNGETFIAPGQMTIDDGTYKFVRTCYLYVNAKDYNTYKPFIEFLMSDKAKRNWEDNGFNPIVLNSK